jgi:hypothetical protein
MDRDCFVGLIVTNKSDDIGRFAPQKRYDIARRNFADHAVTRNPSDLAIAHRCRGNHHRLLFRKRQVADLCGTNIETFGLKEALPIGAVLAICGIGKFKCRT